MSGRFCGPRRWFSMTVNLLILIYPTWKTLPRDLGTIHLTQQQFIKAYMYIHVYMCLINVSRSTIDFVHAEWNTSLVRFNKFSKWSYDGWTWKKISIRHKSISEKYKYLKFSNKTAFHRWPLYRNVWVTSTNDKRKHEMSFYHFFYFIYLNQHEIYYCSMSFMHCGILFMNSIHFFFQRIKQIFALRINYNSYTKLLKLKL